MNSFLNTYLNSWFMHFLVDAWLVTGWEIIQHFLDSLLEMISLPWLLYWTSCRLEFFPLLSLMIWNNF